MFGEMMLPWILLALASILATIRFILHADDRRGQTGSNRSVN